MTYLEDMDKVLTQEYDKLSYYPYRQLLEKARSQFTEIISNSMQSQKKEKKSKHKKVLEKRKKIFEGQKKLLDLLTKEVFQEGYCLKNFTQEDVSKHIVLLTEIKRLRRIIKQKNETELALKVELYQVRENLKNSENFKTKLGEEQKAYKDLFKQYQEERERHLFELDF